MSKQHVAVMSFLNIEDAKKRDAIVSDYLAIVQRLQQKSLNEKAQDLVRHDDIERALEPVVRSTGKSTEAITRELIPIKEEIQALNERLGKKEEEEEEEGNDREERQQEQEGQEEEEEEEEDEVHPNVVEVYYQKVAGDKLDKYFGVTIIDGRYKMGDKYVHVIGPDLVIDRKKYIGTKGLWSLIMRKTPTDYSREDLITYRDVILRTNAMKYPNNLKPTSRVASTTKWREIFPLFEDIDIGEEEELIHRDGGTRVIEEEQQRGSGVVQFLPADIKGMEAKLTCLLGEYRAGNRLCRNEIVSLLDELLRRKRISRKEYQDINTFLQ